MKTKLLKRLRKQADDTYKIVPDELAEGWYIQYYDKFYNCWKHCFYCIDLDFCIKRLERIRQMEFVSLFNKLKRKRDYKRRLKQVKYL